MGKSSSEGHGTFYNYFHSLLFKPPKITSHEWTLKFSNPLTIRIYYVFFKCDMKVEFYQQEKWENLNMNFYPALTINIWSQFDPENWRKSLSTHFPLKLSTTFSNSASQNFGLSNLHWDLVEIKNTHWDTTEITKNTHWISRRLFLMPSV